MSTHHLPLQLRPSTMHQMIRIPFHTQSGQTPVYPKTRLSANILFDFENPMKICSLENFGTTRRPRKLRPTSIGHSLHRTGSSTGHLPGPTHSSSRPHRPCKRLITLTCNSSNSNNDDGTSLNTVILLSEGEGALAGEGPNDEGSVAVASKLLEVKEDDEERQAESLMSGDELVEYRSWSEGDHQGWVMAHGPHFPHGPSILQYGPSIWTFNLTDPTTMPVELEPAVEEIEGVGEVDRILEGVEEDEDDEEMEISQDGIGMVKDIAKIGVPEMLTCMMDPIVSAFETGLVGRLGTLCLAALGPGGNLFIFSSELASAGCICAAAIVSSLRGLKPSLRDMRSLINTSLYCALLAGVVVSLGCNLAIRPMLGHHCSAELAAAVQLYVAIRSVSNPLFFVSSMAEGCFVGLRNSVTPLKIYFLCGLVQLAVMWQWGGSLAGYAGAAAAAQVCGFVLFMGSLARKKLLTLQRPCLEWARKLMSCIGLVTVGTFARMGTYIMMTLTATHMGIVPAAAHKVAYESYYLMSFATEPMFTAANALLPEALGKDLDHARRLTRILMISSGIVGLSLCVFSLVPTHLPIFSQDPQVLAQLRAISPMLALKLLASSMVYAIEGVMIGVGDLPYLTTVHVVNFGIMCSYSFAVQHFNLGLEGMWAGLALYQCLRLAQHSVRLMITQPFKKTLKPQLVNFAR